jgi:hypothetical protein
MVKKTISSVFGDQIARCFSFRIGYILFVNKVFVGVCAKVTSLICSLIVYFSLLLIGLVLIFVQMDHFEEGNFSWCCYFDMNFVFELALLHLMFSMDLKRGNLLNLAIYTDLVLYLLTYQSYLSPLTTICYSYL